MKKYINKAICRIRKMWFKRGFGFFDKRSAIGANGVGKECEIIGRKYMFIGANCNIGKDSELICYESHAGQSLFPKLVLGNHVRITGKCRITCAGSITIGDDVLIAPEVFISDANHGMNPTIGGGYSTQPLIVKSVVIGDGCWLGQKVCILPGVSIGAHSIIGAGSVVTHNIPAYCIAAGNPAKIVKRWDASLCEWVR